VADREEVTMSDRKPMVGLTELRERTSAAGNRYFSGYLGTSQVLLFDGGEQPHPTRPDEMVHVWNLLVQERDQATRPSTRNAERGQRTWDRSHGRECHATRTRAQQAGEAVLAEAGRTTGWSQEREETPFYDDSAKAVADLEGRR
jgi:hypothetical protein